mmetsp:Transcript_23138/g.43797  ORF Transcript_23138/g.43797 Transcript_23138/m.43797 type:complete len:848 (+) Transcript_23138:443-2986(+)|eukprot:CAMPEP_0201677782 /NCGR_PEP_ID=MMETSP0494-20130426/44850_1 /ASSEMBLY_ACC=CAM_ASM_000839 /TAXON_ID=420259 /ORGANISM="Thalassiosira gravida, Strain GMp14c1" /LENGTH=847 /DNA_ID=CAMNT_0048160809 /DNA_START=235 /DNA_END=2778 /DNA_ORIENTATION=+
MDNHNDASSSTDGLALIPCVMHHRDGGYLCLEPKSKSNNVRESAAIASDKDIIPYKKYILEPRGCTSTTSLSPENRIRTRSDFFNVLDQLIGKEVAIQDAETQKYLSSVQGAHRKRFAKFKEKPQFFHLGRTDTGAYYFRTAGDGSSTKKHMYLHKSSKTKSWAMKGSSGRTVDIDTSQVNFSTIDNTSNANDWIIEPDDSVLILDSLPTKEGKKCHGQMLFLGVVDMNSTTDNHLDVSCHFQNVPAAWRSREQWDGAMYSIKNQHSRGDEYCVHTDYVGRKTKWIAKFAPGNKLCVVVTSSNFHQEHLEDCLDKMVELLMLGLPARDDLSDLGWKTLTEEVQSTEKDNTISNEIEEESGELSTFYHVKDVKISLLHRSGGWFSLLKDGFEPDSLYLEPIEGGHADEHDLVGEDSITTTGDYFGQLNKYSKFAVKNERGEYLFSRERQNVFGKEKKHLFKKKYLAAEYAELNLPGETPETFTFGQNLDSGGISITSHSKGCFLSRRKGEIVFMMRDENAGQVCSTNEEDTWFIDSQDLQSGVTSDGLLFAGIVRQHDKKVLVSRHAPGRPTAWRTTDSWDYITDVLLDDMESESSTVVTDSDTGHKWFATNSDGKELFIVIATAGFHLHYGTKALVAMEDLHRTLRSDENRSPSSNELNRLMRDIETQYKYELFFGDSEVLSLIEDVEKLTDKMMSNIDGLKENIAIEQELEDKANQLYMQAEQFKKNATKASRKKYKYAASAVAGGAVVGGVVGWLVGGPAGVILFESQMAEVALGLSLGAAPGIMKGIVLLSTDKFWKRKFVHFGKCIDSRRQKRARGKKLEDLEQTAEDHRVKLERSGSSFVLV